MRPKHRLAMRTTFALVLFAAALPPGSAEAAGKTAQSKRAVSIGAPNRGRLENGAKLKSTPTLKVRPGAHAYALPQLVRALKKASEQVARKFRRSVLFVADLSDKDGGTLYGHHSHQSGRDADVGFYATNAKGKPVPLKNFVPFGGDGKAKDGSGLQFDDARNWALVEALLGDPRARVRYLFVAPPIKGRLIAYAKKKNVSAELVLKASAAMLAPKDCESHDDHFHIRIACPTSMKGACIEESVESRRSAPPDAGAPIESDAPVTAPDNPHGDGDGHSVPNESRS